MASGSAARSKIRAMRAAMSSRAAACGNRTAAMRLDPSPSAVTEIVPTAPPSPIVRA